MTEFPLTPPRSPVLVVERDSDYALDYELMLNGLGYPVVFAPTPAAAGIALIEHPEICLVLVDADSVDIECCSSVLNGIRRLPIVVVAAPEVLIALERHTNVRLCRKPISPREVARIAFEMLQPNPYGF
ncbi:hypothetical protein SAMN03159496_05872 [Rhizobium sp. NFR07]|uniref:hypothetical protein n=1 Tax=Rhizobium sp. NFR07 TaxID=1566262 RepID=UPI0008EE5CCF|nr:hypothetical protein [Rhizobium sp. NFR07]SFB61667.1 hypothetical protein SAMN03159496_05872 [Rhizobium sp. NFR07]